MDVKERLVETRNQLEQLEYNYLTKAISREEFNDLLKLSYLKVKQEESLSKLILKRSVVKIDGLTGNLNPNNEAIACREQSDKFITRGDCDRFSSASENIKNCTSCGQFDRTRRLLHPRNSTLALA